ncbi:MAG: hypothetical protein ACYC5O_22145 [Anaerolineae bacterium]
MSYEFGNDPAKIDGYRRFWQRAPVTRPLMGFSIKSWFPMDEFAASRAWKGRHYLTPEMIEPAVFVPDQERLLREGEWIDDDILRGASPSQAVQWLEPMLGAPLRVLDESTLAPDMDLTWAEIEAVDLDPDSPWYLKYLEFVRVLVAASQGRYPVSHGALTGPSDTAATLRGHRDFVLDLYDAPHRLSDLLSRVQRLFRRVLDTQWLITPLFHGGYFDAQYSLWAPGAIVRMQEDAVGLLSPTLYRQLLQPVDREWAGSYPCAFMHLHSTSMHVLDDMLAIEEIAAFQVNRDVSGPSLEAMMPYYRRVQDAGRPLLVRASFTPDELRYLLDNLSPRGLYLYVMVADAAEIEPLRRVAGM